MIDDYYMNQDLAVCVLVESIETVWTELVRRARENPEPNFVEAVKQLQQTLKFFGVHLDEDLSDKTGDDCSRCAVPDWG